MLNLLRTSPRESSAPTDFGKSAGLTMGKNPVQALLILYLRGIGTNFMFSPN
jgi:hypothetical protein